jgi:hypothetical protein
MVDATKLNPLAVSFHGSLKRRLLMWLARWALGFSAVAIVVHLNPALAWVWALGAVVAAISLITILAWHVLINRRLTVARRRIAEYERLAQEAEKNAMQENN